MKINTYRNQLALAGMALMSSSALATASATNIDIMAVYNADARNSNGGTNNTKAEIMKAIGVTNECFDNSKAQVNVNLVWPHEINYSPAKDQNGNASSDEFIRDLFNKGITEEDRNKIGADLVAIFAPIDAGGRGSMPGDYTVNHSNYIVGNILPHEIGHNLGIGHGEGYGAGTTSYAAGSIFRGNSGTRYASIMVGNYGLNARTADQQYWGFSNPNIYFEGAKTGASNKDAVRRINELRTGAAKVRSLKPQNGGDLGLLWAIENRNSGKVLAVAGANNSNNAAVVQESYYGGNSQLWQIQARPFLGHAVRSNMWNLRSLSVGSGSASKNNFQPFRIYDDKSNVNTGSNMRWGFSQVPNGYIRIRNIHSRKFAQVNGRSTSEGATVSQYPLSLGQHYQWRLRTVN